jgi:lipid II:glycine glycyltransferase (peptidoglycan interpeptide bridge formation enzyme)
MPQVTEHAATDLAWQEMPDHHAWDKELARLNGHPLQSSLWGEARRLAEGLDYRCFAARQDGAVIALARVETRRVSLLGHIAWIPKGPASNLQESCLPSLEKVLRQAGYILCACNPCWPVQDSDSTGPKTIWIDLSVGREQLLRNLDSQWRYGTQRALREGVVIDQTRRADDVEAFFRLCTKISATKGFRLPASQPLMANLLNLSVPGAPVVAHLFVARHNGQPIAGAFVMRVGKHVHYLWGGVDRAYSRHRPGEAVQWAVMQWAVEQGCGLYDLEGIDPVNNPGTYAFKKKMGGTEVSFPGLITRSLGHRGNLIIPFLNRRA